MGKNIKIYLIMVLAVFVVFIQCSDNGDFKEIVNNPNLIASLNNGDEDPENDSFHDEAKLTAFTPTFMWSNVEGNQKFELIIRDTGRGNTYIIPIDEEYLDEDTDNYKFTLSDDYKLDYCFVDKEGEKYPYEWRVRAQNYFQYAPSDIWKFYIVDLEPPTVAITVPDNDTVVTGETKISFTAVDNNSIGAAEISIDGGEWTPVTENEGDTYSHTEDFTSYNLGRHTVCVRAKDTYDNYNEKDDDDCIDVIVLPGIATLEAIDRCATTPTFKWSAVEGVTYYEIIVASDQAFSNVIIPSTTTATTSFTSTTNFANGTYYWRVRAVYVDTNNEEFRGDFVTGNFAINRPVVVPPSGFVTPADGCKGSSFNFTWTAASEHTYALRYSSDGTTWTDVTVTSNSGSATIDITGTYSWQVRSTTVCSETSSWEQAPTTFVVSSPIVPTGPVGPTSACQDQAFVFNWTNAPSHTYTIEYKPSPGLGSWTVLTTGVNAGTYSDTTTFTTSGGNSYVWRIKSTNVCGESQYVDGNIFSVYRTPVNPTTAQMNVAPSSGDTSTVFSLSWTTTADHTYQVQYKSTTSGTWINTTCTNSPCSVGPIAVEATYEWHVLAKSNNCGDGTYVTDDNQFIVTIPCSTLGTISGLNAANGCDAITNFSFTWSSIPNADKIWVEFTLNGSWTDNPFSINSGQLAGTAVNYSTTIDVASDTTNLRWRVRAQDSCSIPNENSVEGTAINVYTLPTGQPVNVDPPDHPATPGGTYLFQDNKPGYYWTTTGVAGHTGYLLDVSNNSNFTDHLSVTPINNTGVANNYITRLTTGLYGTTPSNTSTNFWRVRPYNTLPECAGPWSTRTEYRLRWGGTNCISIDVANWMYNYNTFGMQPLGITYVSTGTPRFFVAVHSATSFPGQHPTVDPVDQLPTIDVFLEDGTYTGTFGYANFNAQGCNYLGDIFHYPNTDRIYVGCNTHPTLGNGKILVFDTNGNYQSVISIPSVNYPSGISIGNDGSDRLFVVDRDIYAYPGMDIPVKEFAITGGATTATYPINVTVSAGYNQYGIWGVTFDPGLGLLHVPTREQQGTGTIYDRSVQTFNVPATTYKYKFEPPPVPPFTLTGWQGNWGVSKPFGPPIAAGTPYGSAPSGRYIAVAGDVRYGASDLGGGIIYRVTDQEAVYIGGLFCQAGMANGPSGIEISPTTYDIWITTDGRVLVGLPATTP